MTTASAIGIVLLAIMVAGCEPRHPANTAAAPQPSTAATVQPTATTTSTAPTAWKIPGLNIPGLPTSPRQAMIGRWNVAAIDGKPVATAPGMATDPMDPASYAAGSAVTFTADIVTLTRGGATFFNKPYKVLSEQPPIRVTIDTGYGPSNFDFAIDGSAVWSLPSTPPHALSLTRAQ